MICKILSLGTSKNLFNYNQIWNLLKILTNNSKKLSLDEESIGCVFEVNPAFSRLTLKVEYKEQQKILLSESIKSAGDMFAILKCEIFAIKYN